jgi:hypothetical protein
MRTTTVGIPARELAPAAVPPTTAAAPSDAAVTAAAPSAMDFLNFMDPPKFEWVVAPPTCCFKICAGKRKPFKAEQPV